MKNTLHVEVLLQTEKYVLRIYYLNILVFPNL